MVVIVILGILAGLIIPRIMGRPEEAKRLKANMQIESLETALKLYKLDNGMYPDTEQGLQALVEQPETGMLPKNWRKGGYLEKGRVPKDPWGNEFVYLSPGVRMANMILFHMAQTEFQGAKKKTRILTAGRSNSFINESFLQSAAVLRVTPIIPG